MFQSLRGDNSIKEPSNIEYVVKNGLCVGCGVCEAACPNFAIKMIYNYKGGMQLPTVNEKRCNRCQICLNVCYGYKVDKDLNRKIFGTYPTSVMGNFISCYTGYSNDPELRYNCSSGGLVTALLMRALDEGSIDGAIVTRMEAGVHPKPKAFIATTIDDVILARGSKYCPVSFAECLKSLENDKRYVIVGLPCHLYGIRKLAEFNPRIRRSVSYYFGILCGGTPTYDGTLYILRRFNMENQFITRFEYRGGGWPGRVLIQSGQPTSGRKIEIQFPYAEYHPPYKFFIPQRCTLCHGGLNEFSDISFGDAWLPHLLRNDKNGTSLIISRTEVGERLIQDSLQSELIQATYIDAQDAVKSQGGQKRFSDLRARINLCRTFRKGLPIFDLSRCPSAKLDSYLSAIWLYLGRAIASKHTIWWLFDIYVSIDGLFNFIGRCATKIKDSILRYLSDN